MSSFMFSRKEHECIKKIKKRFELRHAPDIVVQHRILEDYHDPEGLRRFEKEGRIVVSPPGYYAQFKNNLELFKAEFFQLFAGLDHSRPLTVHLMKLVVHMDDREESAGYKWFAIGGLKNGEKFSTILYALVDRKFRSCGLGSLLKKKEIDLIESMGVDYIQTYLEPFMPYFKASFIPNLENGFTIYPGFRHREEFYREGVAFVHLRKIFRKNMKRRFRIKLFDDSTFFSPDQNLEIAERIMNVDRLPVRCIKSID